MAVRMKWGITFDNKIIAGFAILLAASGIRVLCGYPVGDSFMLACTVLSFFAALVQLLRTRIASLSESQKVYEEAHPGMGKDGGARRSGYKDWYEIRKKRFAMAGDIILYPAVAVSLCLYTGFIPYQNQVLSDGLALLTMSLLFLDSLIGNRDAARINDYKYEHGKIGGGE